MVKSLKGQIPTSSRAKALLIYNPKAGQKKKLVTAGFFSLEELKELLDQYQIPVDLVPTKYPGHATELAKEATQNGYKLVIGAGGDGTIGEIANGLIGTDTTLGIIPLGTFMNVATMLSVPNDLERAIQLIKINRTRRIDVGAITKLGGDNLKQPYYFLESLGIGLEALLQEQTLKFEQGDWRALFKIIKILFDFYGHKGEVIIDGHKIESRAILINISNGPYTGASLPVAPKAKLNDHRLTVNFYKMTKWELLKYFWSVRRHGPKYSSKIETYQGKRVQIFTKVPKLVHADARLFGSTPVEASIVPSALNVITGFPKADQPTALIKRTLLDP